MQNQLDEAVQLVAIERLWPGIFPWALIQHLIMLLAHLV